MAEKVEVYLERHSDGVHYTEFTAPPGTPKYTGDPNEKYIEATTDERFRIVVKLRRGFDFMGGPKVRVEYFVDQGNFFISTLSKNKSQSASPSDRSHRETGVSVIRQFIDGRYMDCGLTFGELKSDDDLDMDDRSVVEEADRQGRIVVKLRRGHFSKQKVEEGHGAKSFDPPEHIDTKTAHNKVVHKHHVSHALKHVPLRPSNMAPAAPGGYRRQWMRATGEGSKPIVFTLRYRFREALLALGIIDENAPVTVASSSKTGDTTMSHRPKAKGKPRKGVRDRSTAPTVATETISSSARSPSQGLTPGPLLSSMMHADDDDDEDDNDEELPVKTRRMDSDTTEQHFSLSARPTMSPTPGQALSIFSPTPPPGPTPTPSAPPVIYSLLTEDEEDGQDSNNNANEHTTFPLFSAADVRKGFALGIQGSQSHNVINGRTPTRDDDNNNDNSDGEDDGEGASSPEGEMVGLGHATPPRYGGSSSRPIGVGLSDQERKRAWSEVLQNEQELEEEEAAAILASEKRERRRRELIDAKRSFLDLD